MPNKIITIQLRNVEYGGDNLGDDIRLDLKVNGVDTVIKVAIDHGTTRTIGKALYRFQSTNNTERIPVSATVTEEDMVYNDVGSASGNLTVTEVERWDELYAQIIGARKGDVVSVGVLEVR